MDYPFTATVHATLARARAAALDLRHDFISPVHLTLGLLGDGQVHAILARAWTSPGAARAALLSAMEPGRPGAVRRGGDLAFTSRAKKSLELALGEARARRGNEVGTRDLLHGVMVADPVVAEVLGKLGITLTTIHATEPAAGPAGGSALAADARAGAGAGAGADAGAGAGHRPGAAAAGAAARSGAAPGPRDPAPVWFLELEPGDPAPMYQQIVRRVEEAVATGALLEGERIPTVRQLAEELGIAPGTVARAFAELEQRGVVATDGARGTRVAERVRARAEAEVRLGELEERLRPIVVAAYHLGAGAGEVEEALRRAMSGVF